MGNVLAPLAGCFEWETTAMPTALQPAVPQRQPATERADLAGRVSTTEGALRARQALRRKARLVGKLKTLENDARARRVRSEA